MNNHSIWMNPTWDGKTFPERVIRDGALPISDATMALFQPYLASPLPADQLVLSLEDRRQILAQPEMALAMRAMTEGAGFVLLRVPDAALHCSRTMTRIAWLASSAFGQPITQNKEPLFIYDVKDVGGSLDSGHRLSQTNKTTGFHTDGSFHAESLDLVALLCLRRAKEGGITQLISGSAVVDALRGRNPRAYARLCKPFRFLKRGGWEKGQCDVWPIISEEEGGKGLRLRWLRAYVEKGQAEAGEPLGEEQVEALDALDEIIHEEGAHAEFFLERGDLVVYQNYSILHNRTDYVDGEEKRHMVRFWMTHYEMN